MTESRHKDDPDSFSLSSSEFSTREHAERYQVEGHFVATTEDYRPRPVPMCLGRIGQQNAQQTCTPARSLTTTISPSKRLDPSVLSV